MPVKDSPLPGHDSVQGLRDPLAAVATLSSALMRCVDAASLLHAVLAGLGTVVAYDHAWLEMPSQESDAAPVAFRATPDAVEPVPITSLLVEEGARCFPLLAGGNNAGRLMVISSHGELALEETRALEVLSGYLSLAMRMAALEGSARRFAEPESTQRRSPVATSEPPKNRSARVGALKAELSQILTAQLGLSILCDRVLERLLSVLGVEAGAMFVYESRSGALQRMAQRGVPGPLPARLAIDLAAPTVLGRATAAAVPVLEQDIFSLELVSSEDRLLRTWGFHSLLCYPLSSGTRIMGGLQLMGRRVNAISADALALLESLQAELVLALQNAMTFERLSIMTVTDVLTGLHNRRFCEEFARKQLLAAQRARRNCALLLVDVDQMRSFNERFGEDAGDAALRGVAAALVNSVRAADLAGRYGGEEFIVVLPNADLDTALSVAERIRTHVLLAAIPVGMGFEQVTVSIGVTAYPQCAENLSQFFNTVDVALFAAKEPGCNRIMAAPLLTNPSGAAPQPNNDEAHFPQGNVPQSQQDLPPPRG